MTENDKSALRWKPKHPGVPFAWTQIGEGGNAIVWSDGTNAIKRLKGDPSREAVERFKREAAIAQSLQSRTDLKIVPVHEIREREGVTEMVMEKLDGNLDELIEKYVGAPQIAAEALLPIVETLHELAAQKNQIHHRDIKPSNILYRGSGENTELYLGDFGCAHIRGDQRITQTNRAVGAWNYRAPEYSAGRVTDVNEKGDVFSLGKVFWALINGMRGVVFPYTLWYLDEYDLVELFPDAQGIRQAQLAIAGAVQAKPEDRPTLNQFAETLRSLATNVSADSIETGKEIEMLSAEAKLDIEYQQRKSLTESFVRCLYVDFRNALSKLYNSMPRSEIVREWINEAERCPQNEAALVEQVAVLESDAPVVNVMFKRIWLISRFHPVLPSQPANFSLSLTNRNIGIGSTLTVFADPTGLSASWRYPGDDGDSTGPYNSDLLNEFLTQTISKVVVR